MRVNYLAVVVSGLVFFGFGALWYTMLSKQWLAAIGPHDTSNVGGAVAYPFIVSLLMSMFLAYGVARILAWRGPVGPAEGALIGFSFGLLIFGSMLWTMYAYEQRGMTLGFINVGYVSIGMAIQGAILAAWKAKKPAVTTP